MNQNRVSHRVFHGLILFLFLFKGCLPPDKPIQLPPPGPITSLQVNLGAQYDKQVFFSLSSYQTNSFSILQYDLRIDFYKQRIWLNTAKYMFVYPTQDTLITQAFSIPTTGKTTDHYLHPDSFALNPSTSFIYIIDRGEPYYTTNRWYKLKILAFDTSLCHLQLAPINATDNITEYRLKPTRKSLYLDFDTGLVSALPDDEEWDLLFTQYTHTYDTLPETDPAKYYLVRGVLLNNGIQAGILSYPTEELCSEAFEQFAIADTQTIQLSTLPGIIGFDWKTYNFSSGTYVIDKKRFYVIKDRKGYFYKLRFYDYYDNKGNKGAPAFQIQRL